MKQITSGMVEAARNIKSILATGDNLGLVDLGELTGNEMMKVAIMALSLAETIDYGSEE